MSDFENVDFKTIAAELSKLSQRQFQFYERSDDNIHYHPSLDDGQGIIFYFRPAAQQRLEIMTERQYTPGVTLYNYMEDKDREAFSGSITVALTRPPLAIAKEINRRLLTPWLVMRPVLIERFEKDLAQRMEQSARCQRLAALCNTEPKVSSGYPCGMNPFTHFYPGSNKVYSVEVYSGGSVVIERITGLTEEEAAAILQFLSTKNPKSGLPLKINSPSLPSPAPPSN